MRLLLVCMLISFFAVAQQNDQQLAYQYYVNGEYEKAISIYKELNKERFSVAYHTPYFSSLLKTEQFKAAEQLAKKAAKLYPNSLNYQIEIGIVQERSGNSRKAERTFKKLEFLCISIPCFCFAKKNHELYTARSRRSEGVVR